MKIYYSLETDVPALQGAHTAACSVSTHHMAHQYTLYVNGCRPMIDQNFTHFALVSIETILQRKVHSYLARHFKSYNYYHNGPAELIVV